MKKLILKDRFQINQLYGFKDFLINSKRNEDFKEEILNNETVIILNKINELLIREPEFLLLKNNNEGINMFDLLYTTLKNYVTPNNKKDKKKIEDTYMAVVSLEAKNKITKKNMLDPYFKTQMIERRLMEYISDTQVDQQPFKDRASKMLMKMYHTDNLLANLNFEDEEQVRKDTIHIKELIVKSPDIILGSIMRLHTDNLEAGVRDSSYDTFLLPIEEEMKQLETCSTVPVAKLAKRVNTKLHQR